MNVRSTIGLIHTWIEGIAEAALNAARLAWDMSTIGSTKYTGSSRLGPTRRYDRRLVRFFAPCWGWVFKCLLWFAFFEIRSIVFAVR